MGKFRVTSKKTGKQFTSGDIPYIAARLVVFGAKPEHFIVEKLLDTGRWVVVELSGKEMYQIEKELRGD